MHRTHPPTRSGRSETTDPPDPARRWLNLGVLAHVDAGKTTLTEALLYAGGAVDLLGRVDDGTTQTDTLALERRRGITIRTAVATFELRDVTVNLVDTPGHPDFIAEVDRSLAVLDGAILVLSAVEGVQAQTIVLYRALRRLRIPALFMINKIDRTGADPERVLAGIRSRLTDAIVPLGTAHDPGARTAGFVGSDWDDPATAEAMTAALAEHDDGVLDRWVNHGQLLDPPNTRAVLGRLTRAGTLHPVLLGSAMTGAGLDELITAVTDLLPAEPADADAPMSGQVFKIERSGTGDRICSVRVRTGRIGIRDHLCVGADPVGVVTGLEVHEPGGPVHRDQVSAGQIARVHGLSEARLGDRLGSDSDTGTDLNFPAPTLETTVAARDPAQQIALHQALTELADIDPLIRLRPDTSPGSLRVTVYGEVQQQVLADNLALDHGIDVAFGSTSVICVERPAGTGHAVLRIGDPDHHYAATLGVTVDPGRPGSGFALQVAVPHTSLPLHIYSTVEGYRETLQGYLQPALVAGPQGWQLTDLIVTVTESDYNPPGPPPPDLRHTAELVLTEAIRRAGTVVCEPVDRFRLEAPADLLSGVLGLLGRHRGIPGIPQTTGATVLITGTIPTAEVDRVRRQLPGVTAGEGLIETALDHYMPQ